MYSSSRAISPLQGDAVKTAARRDAACSALIAAPGRRAPVIAEVADLKELDL